MFFNIQLHGDPKSFRPGDTMEGTVLFEGYYLTGKFRILIVRIRGFEGVDWDYPTRGVTTSEPRYETNKFVVKEEQTEITQIEYVHPNRRKLPFKITLPEDMPGTFRYPNCYLRFSLEIDIVKEYGCFRFDKEITVDSPLDLNLVPEETVLPNKRTTSCLCWNNGLITTNIYMKQRAISYGNSSQIKIEIDFKSRRKIKCIRVTLTTAIIVLTIKQHIKCQDRRKELQKFLQSGEEKEKKRFLRQLLR